jgi:xanthine dehydrogenase molybdenum-binding subunit
MTRRRSDAATPAPDPQAGEARHLLEKGMAELTTVGHSPIRVDGIEKVTGIAKYAADYSLPGILHGKIKRSPYAHARIVGINADMARALPGVKAVLTIHDVPWVRHMGAPAPRTQSLAADQYIFPDKARFVGDGVAAVAAVSEEIAEQALDLIEVEYEVLPAVFDVEEAMRPDAPKIHDTEGNLVMPPIHLARGDIERGFAQAAFILESVYQTGRPVPAYMEPNACVAHFDQSGKLTIWSSTQCPFMVRGTLSEVLGIPLNKIRVVV